MLLQDSKLPTFKVATMQAVATFLVLKIKPALELAAGCLVVCLVKKVMNACLYLLLHNARSYAYYGCVDSVLSGVESTDLFRSCGRQNPPDDCTENLMSGRID